MARQKYRSNINAAAFPLLSSFYGHSVILPQIDQFYVRSNPYAGSTAEDKIGIPEVFFLENVMPMADGLQSISYDEAVAASDDINKHFDQIFWLRNAQEKRTLFVPAHGKNYLYDVVAGAWVSQPIIANYNSRVSVANIKGRTFIHYSKNANFYEWNDPNIEVVDLIGLNPSGINGLVAASAYLVAYSDDTIYWSSILDPADFTPALASTAGSEKLLSLKGKIIYATNLADGFLIFTEKNVISASFSNDPDVPWVFVEVAGSVGVDEPEKITQNTTSAIQYMNSVAGITRYNRSQMEVVYPSVSQFLSGRRFEYFDYTLKRVVEVNILEQLTSKVTYIAGRYLVVSYGHGNLGFAVIYDEALKRWGKLRIEHVDCFEYIGHPAVQASTTGALRYVDLIGTYEDQTLTYEEFGGLSIPAIIGEDQEPYKSLAFLQENGRIVLVNFDLPATAGIGVLILGKFQFIRNRWVRFLETFFENVGPEERLAVSILRSIDGSNFQAPVALYRNPAFNIGRQAQFLGDHSVQNFALQIEGEFAVNSNLVVFDVLGYA